MSAAVTPATTQGKASASVASMARMSRVRVRTAKDLAVKHTGDDDVADEFCLPVTLSTPSTRGTLCPTYLSCRFAMLSPIEKLFIEPNKAILGCEIG
jgi:hypothetical protein